MWTKCAACTSKVYGEMVKLYIGGTPLKHCEIWKTKWETVKLQLSYSFTQKKAARKGSCIGFRVGLDRENNAR